MRKLSSFEFLNPYLNLFIRPQAGGGWRSPRSCDRQRFEKEFLFDSNLRFISQSEFYPNDLPREFVCAYVCKPNFKQLCSKGIAILFLNVASAVYPQ